MEDDYEIHSEVVTDTHVNKRVIVDRKHCDHRSKPASEMDNMEPSKDMVSTQLNLVEWR